MHLEDILIFVKLLLGRTSPPTFDELYSLPSRNTTDQGVYLGLVNPLEEGRHFFTYVGSATNTIDGIEGRTSQHLDPKYR